MIWNAELSYAAERQLTRLPRDVQRHIAHALDELEDDPFRGDVRPLQGRHRGRYRKRVGRYRIIFTPDHINHIVQISAILLRDERTYR